MGLFDHDYAVPDSVSERLAIAWRRIEFARNYSLMLLQDLSDDEWFWTPADFTTHVAWQVGHLAMSEYGLTLFRQRGRQDVDSELMSGKFRKLFMRGTEPQPECDAYPPPAEIRQVLDRVHNQMRAEIADFDGDGLDDPVEAPHAAFATRYGALLFAGDHEMLHAGQIGLLRRLMGKPPLR
jgi:hypothetical protein